MEQTFYTYYCHFLKRNIGDGIQCLVCENLKDGRAEKKKCLHEEIIGKGTREV
jgi:hypothetical protein